MQNKKEDYIYDICYRNQTVYFLDDSNFQDDNSKTDFELHISLPKMSEMTGYIEEYNNNFLDEMDYANEGIICIPCLTERYPVNEKPFIINNDESSVFLAENKVGISHDIEGLKSISVKYILNIDISKPFNVITKDLKVLESENPFFSLYQYLKGAMNVDNDKFLHTFISSARLDVLEREETQFMIIEYYYLRRFVKATKEQAKLAIDEIYGLDYNKTRY